MTEMAIAARGLVKTYPKGVRALDGVGFEVAAGSVFGFVGPNGAGKSTTVKILTTLSRPDSGEAEVAGIDALRHPDQVRRAIGCVAQRSGVDVQATGRENLLLQGRLYGMGGRELERRVDTMLERFGLSGAARRVTRTYSVGMQRKLDVAIGLVHSPRVLFLDEPTTGLDPEARADMWAEIERLAGEEGLTILLTTHYLEEADRLARRVAIVDRGRIVAQGTPDELKSELHGDAVHLELDAVETNGRVDRGPRPHRRRARRDGRGRPVAPRPRRQRGARGAGHAPGARGATACPSSRSRSRARRSTTSISSTRAGGSKRPTRPRR